MNVELLDLATTHISDMVRIALEYDDEQRALVVFDTQNGLTDILTEGYRRVIPNARFVDFDSVTKEEVVALFDEMQPNDLVVLIQSSNFRLDDFRIRLHLFQKKLKVIEHMHLYRNSESVWDVYINSLAYDPLWYRVIGPKIKEKLEQAQELVVSGGGVTLTFQGGLELPKLNIGDYTGMANIGGTFPIGEVFTEAKDFSRVNGSFMVYAFAGTDFEINMHTPFRVDIKEGIVVGWDDSAPAVFAEVIEQIKTNERPLLREIGFGLNRAITRERYPEDITAFERILGLHFSLGEKHSVYKKEGITTHKARFHVDVFPLVDKITADGVVIFEAGEYR